MSKLNWPSFAFHVTFGMVSILLILPSLSAAGAPAAIIPTLHAPFQGTWTPSQSTIVGACGGKATIPVAPSANLSNGNVTMRVRASSNCTSTVMGGQDYARGRVQLIIANWTANSSRSSVANVSLRLDFHVRLDSTSSSTYCRWSSSAYAELEIDDVYVLDKTGNTTYSATAINGFTNSTFIAGNSTHSARDHLRTGFQIPMTINVHHQYVLGLRITTTVQTSSCGPGAFSVAVLDAAGPGLGIRVVSVRY